jgi:hypothetical protein
MESRDEATQWLIDRAEVVETVHLYATGVDTKDFELYRSIFTDEIEVDFSSYIPDAGPMTISADAWVASIKPLFVGLDATQHSMSNARVEIDGDHATCVMYMQAEHFLADVEGESSHTVGGYYTNELVRLPEGWRLTKVKLTVLWQRGNKDVMTLGAQRGSGLWPNAG